jgi:NitT/TauT family transport system substrate-binding protein
VHKRTHSVLIAALALSVALTADAASRPAAAQATKITISHSQKTVDFLPLWIASDAGYFKKRGLDVTVRYLPAQEGVPAILTGEVQMAGIGASDAASAVAQGAKLTLVTTLTPIYTFQFWARADHATAAALKGQRVGITSTTGSLYTGTVLALKQLGLTTSDVVLTPLGGVVNVNNSLLAGSVVAAASHPPATYQFQRAGMVELVDLPKSKIPSVSAGLWVTGAYIQAHRDVVQAIVDAVVEALHREKTDRAYAESEITAHLGVKDKAELDFTYDFYVKEILAAEPMPEAAQIQGDIDALAASNPKVKNLNAVGMLDQSFVKNAIAANAK